MVAADTSATESTPFRPSVRGRAPIRTRSGVQRLLLSLTRIATLQTRLLVLRAKYAAARLAMAAGIAAVGLLLALLGITFLYIGAFRALELVVSPMWAFLIFGFVHVCVAAGLVLYAKRLMSTATDTDDD